MIHDPEGAVASIFGTGGDKPHPALDFRSLVRPPMKAPAAISYTNFH
jgi:hypothetical protein